MVEAVADPGPETRPQPWARYLALSYVGLLIHYLAFLRAVPFKGAMTVFFAGAVFLTGPLWLALPLLLPIALLRRALGPRRSPVTFGLAVAAFTLLHLFFYADGFIYAAYGFHVNGFVWNLVTTRGGIDSLGAGGSTVLTVVMVAVGYLILQLGLLAALLRVPRLRTALPKVFCRRGAWIAVAAFASLLVFEKAVYGWSRFRWKTPILTAADPFPFYIRCDFTRPAKALGLKPPPRPVELDLAAASDSLRLKYPRTEIRRDAGRPPLNVVWLVSESWRWDMLDPEIMPSTHAFAKENTWFRHHYSGGNGTRTGMFSMFYGLYGPYWFPFLAEKRGPVLMDVILDQRYDTWFQTSAAFSYPEFDRTIFSRVPADQLHEATVSVRWERDRESVGKLEEFIRGRAPGKPFMMFMFFESPHANYTFPPECAIRKPYLEDFNYLSADLQKDITPVKNRYVNACRHLDTMIARVLGALRERGLMDSTIVVLTGDHGEEFMEKGRWGHNSEFTEEQTRVPLVLRVPGRAAQEVTTLSSHLDLPATVMTLLGVTTPPEEYSLGLDLLGSARRTYTVVSDWDHLAYVDLENKGVFSLKNWEFKQKVSTKDDAPVADGKAFVEKNRAWLVRILQDMSRFKQ